MKAASGMGGSKKIDMSLFGSATKRRGRGAPTSDGEDIAVVSARVLEKLNQDPSVVFPSPDSVVLSGSEIQRMLNGRVQPTTGHGDSGQSRSARASRAKRGAERKKRMLAMEKERKVKGRERMSELQEAQAAAKADVLSGAQRMLDENHDDVKKMNSMMLYAKCVAIRDRQIQEKEEALQVRVDENRRIELQMEANRRKMIAESVRRDERRDVDRKIGARIIVKQMAELEARRAREKEEKYQEGQAIIKRIAMLDLKEQQKEEGRIARGRALIAEVEKANDEASRARIAANEKQRLEDEKIARYIADKQAREAEYEREVERLREAKEKQQQKMVEKQEAQMGQSADLDALRARRAQEGELRKYRDHQAAKAEAKRVMIHELGEARERQRQEKEFQMAEQARKEREEFNRVIDGFRDQEREDQQKAVLAKSAQLEYKAELQAQVEDGERRRGGGDILIEQKLLREKNVAERKKLENIKRIKLLELERAGVPKKYRSELAKYKPLGGQTKLQH